jgi:hypothetical protein
MKMNILPIYKRRPNPALSRLLKKSVLRPCPESASDARGLGSMESLCRSEAPQEPPSPQATLCQRSYLGLGLKRWRGTESKCLAGTAVRAMLRVA